MTQKNIIRTGHLKQGSPTLRAVHACWPAEDDEAADAEGSCEEDDAFDAAQGSQDLQNLEIWPFCKARASSQSATNSASSLSFVFFYLKDSQPGQTTVLIPMTWTTCIFSQSH